MIGIKDQYFGTEIEMTGITRQRAAEVVAEMFGTEAYYDGTTYGVWSVIDLEGKNRKIKRKSKEKEAEKIDDARLIWYNIPKIIITYNITIKE